MRYTLLVLLCACTPKPVPRLTIPEFIEQVCDVEDTFCQEWVRSCLDGSARYTKQTEVAACEQARRIFHAM